MKIRPGLSLGFVVLVLFFCDFHCIISSSRSTFAFLLPCANAADDGILYHNGFESQADLQPEWMATSSQPVLLRKAIDSGDAIEGKASFLAEYRMRKEGYFYPGFNLPEHLSLENGPLYLSGYVKIEEQHPEANHHLALGCAGQFPKKTQGWNGLEIAFTQSIDLPNGWTYFFSDDLRDEAKKRAVLYDNPYEGVFLSTVYLSLWSMRPGEILRYRLDNIRFTRYNPVPAPDENTYNEALKLYQQFLKDRTSLEKLKDPAVTQFITSLETTSSIFRDTQPQGEKTARALFVGKVREMERLYWRLKVLELSESKDIG